LPEDCQRVAGANAVTIVDEHSNNSAWYQRGDVNLDNLERTGGYDRISLGSRARDNHNHTEPERAIHE
jgi:hypothetical protein